MTDDLLDLTMPPSLAADVLEGLAAYLKAITRPCPDCGGKPWADDERARYCLICETFYHDDGGAEEMLDLIEKVRSLHA